jgi:hypothetical protein
VADKSIDRQERLIAQRKLIAQRNIAKRMGLAKKPAKVLIPKPKPPVKVLVPKPPVKIEPVKSVIEFEPVKPPKIVIKIKPVVKIDPVKSVVKFQSISKPVMKPVALAKPVAAEPKKITKSVGPVTKPTESTTISKPVSKPQQAKHQKPVTVLKDGAWKGRRCFVVGGGASLKDFDFDLLEDELWIGINAVWLSKVPDISYTHDKRVIDLFHKDNSEAWKKLPCRIHKHEKQIENSKKKYGNVHTFKGAKGWSKSFEDGLFNGNNSGVTALNIADILGADPIYLIGFDMKKAGDANHFHNYYPKAWKQPDKVYNNFNNNFNRIKKNLVSKVINLTSDSALNAFEKKRVDEIFG